MSVVSRTEPVLGVNCREAVDAYVVAEQAAWDIYTADRSALSGHALSVQEGISRFEAAVDRYDRAVAVARDRLLEAAGHDRLVHWIVENPLAGFHPVEATQILSLLPATLSEIERFVTEQGWCTEWEEYVQRAKDQGALE